VRDAGVACDAHLRCVYGTHRITYHSAAASLITYLQTILLRDIILKSEVYIMSESKLRELSMDFSVDIIELVKYLKSIKESIISNQIGRSGTSIGANIHEAQYAQGKKDFVSKLEIALKEASETGYWLELLYRTKYIDEQTHKTLSAKCTSLRAMLIASCRTAKENTK
jgi:four helix bundle protein